MANPGPPGITLEAVVWGEVGSAPVADRHAHVLHHRHRMSRLARRLTLFGLVLVAALFVRLGFWQLDRLGEQRAANRAAELARAEPPRELGAGADWTAAELSERWVEAAGAFDHAHEIVIRGQAFQGAPGVLVVTPLRLAASDSAVLVLRGFVPAADAVRADLDTLGEPGRVRVRGLATRIPTGGGQPLAHGDRTTWARLDLTAIRDRLPYPVLPVLVRQTPDSGLPGRPRRLPAPELGEGPHLSYAVQWFAFAAMTVAFGVLVVARAGRAKDPTLSP
jgi:surfeit locus 1 family protein